MRESSEPDVSARRWLGRRSTRRAIALLLLALAAIGVEYCTRDEDEPSQATLDDRRRFEDQLFRVDRVIDGDTVILEDGTTIRYVGVDAPEIVPEPECGAVEALDLNREIVDGKAVTVRLDPAATRDRFGRLLAYLDRDGENVSVALTHSGWACAFPFGETRRYRQEIEAAEEEARAARRGVWGACPPVPRGCPR